VTNPVVFRGSIFRFIGPFTNAITNPLIIDSLTMDGGVPVGNTGYYNFVVRLDDGDGWDISHDAILLPECPPRFAPTFGLLTAHFNIGEGK
jgi:hypothetical protein